MRVSGSLIVLGLFGLSACSGINAGQQTTVKSDPETMLLTYHVKTGKEGELEGVLAQAWALYRKEHLVLAEPHVLVRGTEDGGKTRLVEIFTWVSHAAPDHAPASVQAVWEQEQALCEGRDGHAGIDGSEVKRVVLGEK